MKVKLKATRDVDSVMKDLLSTHKALDLKLSVKIFKRREEGKRLRRGKVRGKKW